MVEIKDLNNPKEKDLCNSNEDYSYRKCVDDFVLSDMFKVIILNFYSVIHNITENLKLASDQMPVNQFTS